MICSILGQGFGLLCPQGIDIMNIVGLSIAIVISLGAGYGLIFGWKQLTIRPQEIVCDTLPQEFDGFKIVQLSDLHVATFENCPEFIEKVVKEANSQQADLIVFTGDLVTLQSNELRPFTNILSQLNSKNGVISILGNHDYAIYGNLRNAPREREADKQNLVSIQKEMGWDILLNEHRIIKREDKAIAIIGVENEGKEGNVHKARLSEATKDIPANAYQLLLTHDPEHWRKEILPNTNIPLTLSGHTHAGHFRIGNFSPAKWMAGKEWGGLYTEGKQMLFVSAGIGGSLPFRLGAWPEINVITLRSKH